MRWIGWFLAGALAAGGCARPHRTESSLPVTRPSTRPTGDAALTLDQIEPRPSLPAARATTRPAEPPLDALQLYARALAARAEGDVHRQVTHLREALTKDPDSFDLHYALGLAHLASGLGADLGLQNLERAAELEPDHLELQFQLGRQCLAKNDLVRAIERLRLALQTREYRTDNEGALRVNLTLARALQQKGYDTAALEQYEVALGRLQGRINYRAYPDLYQWHSRPQILLVQLGMLCERLERWEDALRHYGAAAELEAGNLSIQAGLVRSMMKLGRLEEAETLGARLVAEHHAAPEAMNLLRLVYREQGREQAIVERLRQLAAERPDDAGIVVALADALVTLDQKRDAEQLLENALRKSNVPTALVRRLFEIYLGRHEVERAARLVIESLARHPDESEDFMEMWGKLSRGAGKSRLRLQDLRQLEVAPEAAAAKLAFIARAADSAGRETLARSSLQQAVEIAPPFAPAYRSMLELYVRTPDWDDAKKEEAVQGLIARAEAANQKSLAAELRGLWLMVGLKKYDQAIAAFQQALQTPEAPASVRYMLALALINAKQVAGAETVLWELLSKRPSYDPAYLLLHRIYWDNKAYRPAERLMTAWQAADPASVALRLVQAQMLEVRGQTVEAETLLLQLFHAEPQRPEVLAGLASFYQNTKREADLLAKLDEQRLRNPSNRLVVQELVVRLRAQKRTAEADKILQQVRAAAGRDTEHLYEVAHIYQLVEQEETAGEVLGEILKIDPKHPGASNDLGYMWADQGKNLPQAEAMIRVAVAAESDNSAYLDSLGWVLYKRGQFVEAERYLRESLRLGSRMDPAVLDHLGDVLYRLRQEAEARKLWQRALERLTGPIAEREDMKKLKLQLKQKIEQQKEGRPVSVAPVPEA